ncbi:hypothetical protein [Halomonas sp. B23F22_10]|uniref:hypothetical protein n=1 Tax=Halomonas sp. B23F22_10 TaxID=3459515 RepID=UPI00373E74CD
MTALQPTVFERGLRSTEEIIGRAPEPQPEHPRKKRQRTAAEFEDGPRRQRIALLAVSRRPTKQALADEIDVSRGSVSNWCSGSRRVPDHHIAKLEAIACGRA